MLVIKAGTGESFVPAFSLAREYPNETTSGHRAIR